MEKSIKHAESTAEARAQERDISETVRKVREMIEKQYFADWYNSGRFSDYLHDSLSGISRQDIETDLRKMIFRG